mmetsp:Transcript_7578/g.12393  ORF Transcript_7578/g.12393 Transcript_7578/m.12393 type:complete len:167 (+) Transcript_7578:1945-2445(+)
MMTSSLLILVSAILASIEADPIGIPAGVVLPFAGETVPSGYLLCNGDLVSVNKYNALFNAIGFMYGKAGNETFFRLPDYRGLFLRSIDGQAGIDVYNQRTDRGDGVQGDAVGTKQQSVGGCAGNGYGNLASNVCSGFTSPCAANCNGADKEQFIPPNISVMYIVKY